MPSAEQMPGIQSTNLMCTSEPLRGLREKEATSMRKKNPAANWIEMVVSFAFGLELGFMGG
jgi:hypothetical protein